MDRESLTRRQLAIHIGLFAACCVTTYFTAELAEPADSRYHHVGVAFAGTLMGILACHEAGHYWVGRRHGLPVSLPYFIPLPPWVSLGTLGAVIQMSKPIRDPNKLFDVGAAGPVAGLVIAIPLLVIGLSISELGPLQPDSVIEGNSLLYALLKFAVFGRWLPGDGVDVQLHPMAFAGWVGLLLTMINLLPIGQLDGGHIAQAVLGARHERWSARLHLALPVVGATTGVVMFVIARAADKSLSDALSYAKYGVLPWLIWSLLILVMRRQAGEYHPATDGSPLDPVRRRRAIALVVVFCAIATPVPFRPVL